MPTSEFFRMRIEPYTEAQTALVKHIRQYSIDHYEENGWDECYECYTDDQILDLIEEGKAKTEAEAVAAVEKWLKISKAYGDDIRNA